jgi:type II secretory pathway pseudopilin PulG
VAPGLRSPRRAARGFTYVGLLLAVALSGVALAGAGTLWSTQIKRDREADLIFIGDQYRRAITSFYETTPAGQQPRFPANFEELLQDRRFPTVRRHLRKVFADPITGTRDWGILRGPGNSIAGVHSRSTALPLKRDGFPSHYQSFGTAKSYSDWQFVYTPTLVPGGAGDRPGKPASPPGTGTPFVKPPAERAEASGAAPSAKATAANTAACEEQRLRDLAQCFESRSSGEDVFRQCITSASRRQSACLRGEAMVPLEVERERR